MSNTGHIANYPIMAVRLVLNATQKACIALGLAIAIAMCIFPPWKDVLEAKDRANSIYKETPIGYAAINKPPKSENPYASIKIDIARLAIQLVIVIFAVGLGVLWGFNATQKITIAFGLAIAIAMCIFPPWKDVLEAKDRATSIYKENPIGYAAINKPPKSENQYASIKIDIARLTIQIVIVIFAGSLFILMPLHRIKESVKGAVQEWYAGLPKSTGAVWKWYTGLSIGDFFRHILMICSSIFMIFGAFEMLVSGEIKLAAWLGLLGILTFIFATLRF